MNNKSMTSINRCFPALPAPISKKDKDKFQFPGWCNIQLKILFISMNAFKFPTRILKKRRIK